MSKEIVLVEPYIEKIRYEIIEAKIRDEEMRSMMIPWWWISPKRRGEPCPKKK